MPKVITQSYIKPSSRKTLTPYSKPLVTQIERAPSSDISLRRCALCQSVIPSKYDEVYDLKLHYTLCYIKAGKFSPFLAELGGDVKDFKRRIFQCPDLCNKRSMIAVEFLIHLGITHEVTREIMAEDQREIFNVILSKCFPNPIKEGLTTLKTLSKKQQKTQPNVAVSPRINVLPTRIDEENVDDPGTPSKSEEEPQKLPSNVVIKKETNEYDYFDRKPSLKPIPPSGPRVNKIHRCLMCDKKEGRNLSKDRDIVFHYSNCYYEKHKFKNIIDPGAENKDENGDPVDEFKTFMYKCLFPACDVPNGRMPAKMMNFKAYAIHCSNFHSQLEVALNQDSDNNVEEVMNAVLRHRQENGQHQEKMLPVHVEEIHKCKLCDGETNKEAKSLSFHKDKLKSMMHHYANCYYERDLEVYLSRNPPGPENTDSSGRPLDSMGTSVKYTCPEGCKDKSKYGYKSFCIHLATEHGRLEEIMRQDPRQDLRDIAQKLFRQV